MSSFVNFKCTPTGCERKIMYISMFAIVGCLSSTQLTFPFSITTPGTRTGELVPTRSHLDPACLAHCYTCAIVKSPNWQKLYFPHRRKESLNLSVKVLCCFQWVGPVISKNSFLFKLSSTCVKEKKSTKSEANKCQINVSLNTLPALLNLKTIRAKTVVMRLIV